jgi:hypothetical protein
VSGAAVLQPQIPAAQIQPTIPEALPPPPMQPSPPPPLAMQPPTSPAARPASPEARLSQPVASGSWDEAVHAPVPSSATLSGGLEISLSTPSHHAPAMALCATNSTAATRAIARNSLFIRFPLLVDCVELEVSSLPNSPRSEHPRTGERGARYPFRLVTDLSASPPFLGLDPTLFPGFTIHAPLSAWICPPTGLGHAEPVASSID